MKPSLKSLIDRAKTNMIQKLRKQNPAIDAFAAAIGGASYGQYAYQDYLFQQLHPETADEEWLALWAVRLTEPRITATYATGTVLFEGVQGIATIPVGVIIKTQDGLEFEVTELSIPGEPTPITSVKPGSASNLEAGVDLFLVSSVTGLNPDEITSISVTGGTDQESLENWRARVVSAYNKRLSVGRVEDYKSWAVAAHPEVEFAKVKDNTPDTGNVTVYLGKRAADPTVSQGAADAVDAYIDTLRLGGLHLYYQQTTPQPIEIILADVEDIETRQSIEQALENYINQRMGDDDPISPGQLVIEISKITDSFSLVAPTNSVTPTREEVITLGKVLWL